MNYQRIYNELITNRQNNPLPKETYTEKHHIVPKSHGGSNDKDNIVALSAREHFIAHWLLWRIHRDEKMAYAFYAMIRDKTGNRYRNSRGFQEARKIFSENMSYVAKNRIFSDETKLKLSKLRTGSNNSFFGKNHTDETKLKIRNARLGGVAYNKGKKMSDDQRRKLSDAHKGKKFSDEHKAKISKANSGINHNLFDSKIYKFKHKNGEYIECTQYEMKKQFGKSIHKIIVGYRKTYKGWSVCF